jgi:16S rRNA (uracil1498-N3)-methyltransferase
MAQPAELSKARLFHLAEPPSGGRARLCAEDERHATSVLRISAGEVLFGGDGRGSAWPFEVHAAGRSGLELRLAGEPVVEPPPGAEGSSLPRIEVAVALPRGGRAEEMLARLTQLGVAAVIPLVCERGQGPLREPGAARVEHLRRALREACKQCRRLWTPDLREAVAVAGLRAELPASDLLVLEPRAESSLLAWARARASEPERKPIGVAIGPEGGFTEGEREQLRGSGATEARLGAYILRVETAAEAAVAVLAAALER